MSIGSVLTLAGVIAFVVSLVPQLQQMSWRPWLDRLSIFKAYYNPVELVTKGESLGFNLAMLGGIGIRLHHGRFRRLRGARPAANG